MCDGVPRVYVHQQGLLLQVAAGGCKESAYAAFGSPPKSGAPAACRCDGRSLARRGTHHAAGARAARAVRDGRRTPCTQVVSQQSSNVT